MDRAFASGAKGCRFESCRAHHVFHSAAQPHRCRRTVSDISHSDRRSSSRRNRTRTSRYQKNNGPHTRRRTPISQAIWLRIKYHAVAQSTENTRMRRTVQVLNPTTIPPNHHASRRHSACSSILRVYPADQRTTIAVRTTDPVRTSLLYSERRRGSRVPRVPYRHTASLHDVDSVFPGFGSVQRKECGDVSSRIA